MYPVQTPGMKDDSNHKIQYPTSMYKVEPIDRRVEPVQSQLEKIISEYDNIIDTALAQQQLLENNVTLSPASHVAPKAATTASKSPKANVKITPLTTKFKYSWPTDLLYPHSIAVKANSAHIPVTPWLLRRIFGSQVHVRVLKHSSFKGVLPNLTSDNGKDYNLNEVKIIFTVIFNDNHSLEFVDDPLRHGIMYDEHNLQRYLLRLFNICPPITDPFQNAIAEGFVDDIGLNLLRKQKPPLVKKTLAFLENELQSKNLLVQSDKPTVADFSLFAATYEQDLKGFAKLENFRGQLETFYGVAKSNDQWFL